MLDVIVKSTIFLILLALGGYFFVLFRKKSWFIPSKSGDESSVDFIQIVSRLPIGGRGYLAVVRCNQQKFLVGVSSGGITSIGEIKPSSVKAVDAVEKKSAKIRAQGGQSDALQG